MLLDSTPSKTRAVANFFPWACWFGVSRSHAALALVALAVMTGIGVVLLPNHRALVQPLRLKSVPKTVLARDMLFWQVAMDSSFSDPPDVQMLSPELPKLHLFFLATETQQVALPSIWYSWMEQGISRIQAHRFPSPTPSDLRTVKNLITVSYLHDANDMLTGQSTQVCDQLSLSCVSKRLTNLARSYDFVWPLLPDTVPTGSADRLWTLLHEEKKSLMSLDRLKAREDKRWHRGDTFVEFGTGLILRRSEIQLLENERNSTELSETDLLQSLSATIWSRLPSAESVNLGYANLPPVARAEASSLSWTMECPGGDEAEQLQVCGLARDGVTMVVNRTILEVAVRNPLYFAARPFNDQTQVEDCPKKLDDGTVKYIEQTWEDPTPGPKDVKEGSYGPEPALQSQLHPDDADNWSPIKMYKRDSERPAHSSHTCGLKEFLAWRLGL